MSLLLLAACGLFQPAETDDTTPRSDRADTDGTDTTDTTDTEETRGSTVSFVTTEATVTYGADREMDVPDGGTFVRVDSCYEDDADGVVCDMWAGGYLLYDDGTLVLTPNAWDGPIARVTWLVIE